jgi:hypothetical protein
MIIKTKFYDSSQQNIIDTGIELPTCFPTHYHTSQHRIHVEHFTQPNFPHSDKNRETTQIKKPNKTKDIGVCETLIAPHPHKDNKKNFAVVFSNVLRHSKNLIIA